MPLVIGLGLNEWKDPLNLYGGKEPDFTKADASSASSRVSASSKPVFSDRDRSKLVDTIIAEAGGEGSDGMRAVASVIKNRSEIRGKSPVDIVAEPDQFTGYSKPGADALKAMKDPSVRKAAEDALDGVFSGSVADPTGGADFYHAERVNPSWASKFQKTAQIGNHLFYKSTDGRPKPATLPSAQTAYAPGLGIDQSGDQAKDAPFKAVLSPDQPSKADTSWLKYSNQGATRNQPIAPKLQSALSFLPDLGISMEVFSGGQPTKAEGGPRTGSERHDHGGAADVFFYKDGRRLDWANPNDVPVFQEIVQRAKQNGVTGFGAGDGYMREGSMHIGFGKPGVWGAGGRGTNAPSWLRSAFDGTPTSTATAYADGMKPAATPAPTSKEAGKPIVVDANLKMQDPMGLYGGHNPFSVGLGGEQVDPAQQQAQASLQAEQNRMNTYNEQHNAAIDRQQQLLEASDPDRYKTVTEDDLEAWTKQWKADNQSTGVAGDVSRMATSGVASLARSADNLQRMLVTKIPFVGPKLVQLNDAIERWSMGGHTRGELLKRIAEKSDASVTDEQQAADAKKWTQTVNYKDAEGNDRQTLRMGPAFLDPRSYLGTAVRSAPETIATMAPGGLMARGAFRVALAKGLTEEAASAAASKTAALTGSVVEGVFGGSDSALNIRDQIAQLPPEVIQTSEAYKSARAGGMTHEQAVEAITQNAETQAFILSGVATGIFGGFGDKALAKILAEGVKGGLVRRTLTGAAKGVVSEGLLEELPQSALSQVAENKAMQTADPRVKLTDNVAEQAVGGLAGGGVMGAGFGGVGGVASRAEGHEAPQPHAVPGAAPSSPASPTPSPAPDQPRGPLGRAVQHAEIQQRTRTQRDAAVTVDGLPAVGTTVRVDHEGIDPFMGRVEGHEGDEVVISDSQSGEVYQVPKQSVTQIADSPENLQAAKPKDDGKPKPIDDALPDFSNDPALEPSAPIASQTKSEPIPERDGTVRAIERIQGAPKPGQRVIVDDGESNRFPARIQSYEEGATEALVKNDVGEELQVPIAALHVDKSTPKQVDAEELKRNPPVEREIGDAGPNSRRTFGKTVVFPDENHAALYDLAKDRLIAKKAGGAAHTDLERVSADEVNRLATKFKIAPAALISMADDYRYRADRAGKDARSQLPQKLPPVNGQMLRKWQAQHAKETGGPEPDPADLAHWWDVSLTQADRKRILQQADVKRNEKVLWASHNPTIQKKLAAFRSDGALAETTAVSGSANEHESAATEAARPAAAEGDAMLPRDSGGTKHEIGGGTIPKKGLVVANIHSDGKVYIGEPGDVHFSVADRYADKGDITLTGFITPEGDILTREEALKWVSEHEKSVKPSDNMPNGLDALDYREQVPAHLRKGAAQPEEVNASADTGAEGSSKTDEAAHEAATSPKNDLPEPSQAHKEAGNYRKGHVRLGGLDISIENPEGSERKGVDPKAKPWSIKMQSHYGYIKGTVGKDKDHIDVFVKPGTDELPDTAPVFVIDQQAPNGKLDEHKVMLGYATEADARKAYLANYTKGWRGLGDITETTLGKFKNWLREGDTQKPFAPKWFTTAEKAQAYIDKNGMQASHQVEERNKRFEIQQKMVAGEEPIAADPSEDASATPASGNRSSKGESGRPDAKGEVGAQSPATQNAPTSSRDALVAGHQTTVSEEDDKVNGTDELAEGAEVQEGPFGPILRDYEGNWKAAALELERRQTGDAIGALHHPAVGPIDLVWGNAGTNQHNGAGLAKLLAWHPEVLDDLQGFISRLKVDNERTTTRRIQLEDEGGRATVRLDYDGVAKSWLLTAFEKDSRRTERSSRRLDDLWGDRRPASSPPRVDENIEQVAENVDPAEAESRNGRRGERSTDRLANHQEDASSSSPPSIDTAPVGDDADTDAGSDATTDTAADHSPDAIAGQRTDTPVSMDSSASGVEQDDVSEARPAKQKKPKPRPLLDRLENYFRPGREVEGYGKSVDRVLSFDRGEGGHWSVTVAEVKPDGSVDHARTHRTAPDERALAKWERHNPVPEKKKAAKGEERAERPLLQQKRSDVKGPPSTRDMKSLPLPQREEGTPILQWAKQTLLTLGRKSGHEHLIAVDDDGSVVASGTAGKRSRTGMSDELYAALANPDRKLVVFHNHPGNSPASLEDISMLPMPGLYSIWAIGHEGRDTRVELTEQAREQIAERGEDPRFEMQRIMKSIDSARHRLKTYLQRLVNKRTISAEEAQLANEHLPAIIAERAGVIGFETSRPYDPGAVPGLNKQIDGAAGAVAEDFFNGGDRGNSLGRPGGPTGRVRHIAELGRVEGRAQDVAGEHDRPTGLPSGGREDDQGEAEFWEGVNRQFAPVNATRANIISAVGGALSGKFTDAQPTLLATVPLNYFPELAHGNIPAISDYLLVKRQMDAYRGEKHDQAVQIIDQWRSFMAKGFIGIDKHRADQLADLMHASTLAGIDPSLTTEEERAKPGYTSLRKQFMELPPKGREIFTGVRDAYRRQADETDQLLLDHVKKAQQIAMAQAEARHKEALADLAKLDLSPIDRRMKTEELQSKFRAESTRGQWAAKARLTKLRQQFESNRVPAPYFPLARFGRYFVTARDIDGSILHFSRHETEADKANALRTVQQELPNAEVTSGVMEEAGEIRKAMDPRVVAEIEKLLADSGVDPSIRDALYQRYLETMPDLSMRKRFIHRKGTAGYNRDAFRVFASTQFHAAHQLARLKYGLDLQENVNRAVEQAKSLEDNTREMTLVNEFQKRDAWVRNPTGAAWTNWLTSAAYVWYMGASPAAALVNASQTWMMGVPLLGAKFGVGKSATALAVASKEFFAGRGDVRRSSLSKDERAAMDAFYKSGLIDRTQSHDLAAVGETGTRYNPIRARVMRLLSWGFHNVEVANREITALAAYRLARDAGQDLDKAIATAHERTYAIHFDMSNSSRPRIMQNDYVKTAFMFRAYQINMLYRLFRDAHQAFQGDTKAVRREAQMQLAGNVGMMALMAGVTGTAGYGFVMAAAEIFKKVFGDDDDPMSVEDRFKAGVVETLGPELGGMVLNGVPGHLLGIDLTSRIGMPDLWFRSSNRDLSGKEWWQEYVLGSAGAGVSMIGDMIEGFRVATDENNVARGLEVMAPKVLRDLLKATRYGMEGVKSRNGDEVLPRDEVSWADVIKQGLGFTPAKVSEVYDRNNALRNAEKQITDQRRRVMNQFADAVQARDPEARADALAALREFNMNPAHVAVRITSESLKASVKARARNRAKKVDGVLIQNEQLGAQLRRELAASVYR